MREESRARKQFLVEILLPRTTGDGQQVAKDWFDRLCKELTERFGGVTSFLRSPADGFWSTEHSLARENIAAVLEVMTGTFDDSFWWVWWKENGRPVAEPRPRWQLPQNYSGESNSYSRGCTRMTSARTSATKSNVR